MCNRLKKFKIVLKKQCVLILFGSIIAENIYTFFGSRNSKFCISNYPLPAGKKFPLVPNGRLWPERAKQNCRMSHSHSSLWANANLVSARRVSKLQSNNNYRYFTSTGRFVEMRLRLRLRASHHQLDLVVQDDLHSFLQVLQILLTRLPSSTLFQRIRVGVDDVNSCFLCRFFRMIYMTSSSMNPRELSS